MQRKIFFIAFFLVTWVGAAFEAEAQRGQSKNLPYYDDRKLRYGFQLGIHQSRYNIKHDSFFAAGEDSTTAVHPQWSSGFMLGLIMSYRLGDELWNLRLVPNVSFYERNIMFKYVNSDFTEIFESTFVELPILVKYKSVRRGNHRMYMVGGLTASMKVGGKKERLDETKLQTRNHNVEITYGFGWDLYFDMFKFAPELRFSHGIPNVLTKNGNRLSNNIERITTHRVTLVLNFE